MSIKGGPAFPSSVVFRDDGDFYEGMSLRDYLAAKAMQTLAAYEEFPPKRAAERAYEYADEMLKARGEG